jgi:low temperature requirement protein LtrA
MTRSLLRPRRDSAGSADGADSADRVESGASTRVTNSELLFDLVYVFAVTQLSHYLISEPTVEGALRTLILLGLVWEAWAYTMWTTNWLDPDRGPVRAMLFALALGSLVLSVALPQAFADRGWAVAGAYAAMQIGRSIFTIFALPDNPSLRRNYERILCWCLVSGSLALVGAGLDGHARELLWAGAVAVDLLGGVTGFYTPGLGRSSTTEWTVDGGHVAERCHAFVLIALGESVVVLGASLADIDEIDFTQISVFVFGFLGVIALWWLYFARSAESAAAVIATAPDPGRIARAYHELHPVMIGGIIVIAAADDLVLQHPLTAATATTWTVLGGSALFIAGQTAFKAYLWQVRPLTVGPRIAAVLILLALLALAPHIAPIGLAACALVVLVGICISDSVAADRGPDGPS